MSATKVSSAFIFPNLDLSVFSYVIEYFLRLIVFGLGTP